MKATPEQWANMADAASDGFDDGYGACILELRARVEALEAAQQGEEADTVDYYAALSAQHQGRAVFHDGAVSERGSSLVERVMGVLGHYGPGTARAVIREVAEWLREEGYPSSPGRLEREVEQ